MGAGQRVAGEIILRVQNELNLSADELLQLPTNRRSKIETGNSQTTYSAEKIERDGNPNGRCWGETVVFTGNLDTGPIKLEKWEAAECVHNAGCKVDKKFTQRRTTIFVFGRQDLKATKGETKSRSHRDVEEFNKKAGNVKIMSESEFFEYFASEVKQFIELHR